MDQQSAMDSMIYENLPETFHHIYFRANIYLIIISSVIVIVMKIMTSIFNPWNYVLDMTTRKFCKHIAEIDNTLRYRRGIEGEYHQPAQINNTITIQQQSNELQRTLPVNCATDLTNNNNNISEQHSSTTESCENNNNDYSNPKAGSTDHVYSNGWIPIIESYKVKPGTIKKAIIFGRDLIITRSLDGKEVSVLDAYCPHMGVHIGIGGTVKEINNESCLQCPFHGWLFRSSDGQCVKIPYQKSNCSIPKQAKLNTWTCVEVDNFIYVWHHIDQQPPSWFLTPSDLLKSKNWTLIGRSNHKTNLELRDVLENGADMNHFEGIHNDLFILGSNFTKLRPLNFLQKYCRHHWAPDWKPIINEVGKITHRAEMKLQSWISLFKLRLFDITVRAIQTGPARVDLFYNSNWYGKGLLIMNAIPLGGRQTKYIQHVYTERTLFQCFMAKWVLYGEIKMLERDFFIWNHKKNIRNPIFIPEDKTLKQFRLWYSQFYKRKRKITIQNDPKQFKSVDNNNLNGTFNNNNIDF